MSADNLSLVTNGTMNLTMCDLQPNNPYCGIYGPQRVVEAVYMTLLVVIGTIGNLMVIFSIMLEKRIHKNGNIFIINLAVADIFVTGFFLPTVLANVIYTGNSLNKPACDVAGYVITLTCVCSVSNLTVIAINRYWAVVKNKTYAKMFSKRRVYIMVLLVWVWSNLLVIPTLFGWSGLTYDEKMMECAWDDMKNRSYNIFLVVCAILLPVGVIVFCYYNLYKSVRSRGAWARSATSVGSRSNDRQRRSLQRETNLLKTLAMTVVLFVVCWTPYGFVVVFDPFGVAPTTKKIVAWMGLSNSVVNFIIYGTMNPVFRKGYKHLIIFVLCCKRRQKGRRGTTEDSLSLPIRKQNSLEQSSNKKTNLSQTMTPVCNSRKEIQSFIQT
uniref:5-hydroxytryptamine receptor-like isoform X1 n=1 Tax=Ciona intestinalis TaxID=7719 RepID=UPI000180C404|nr:5-hydroxytryptamine receptor-like isoform X1 [Ciona intestinalis]|eukprot:XP_002130281.1 5-hydroxytryptamine receptor-like isoform X1 [Ciona intestinalis]